MPDIRGHVSTSSDLAAVFRHFATHRCGHYAPLYSQLGAGIANDPALLAIAGSAAPGQSPPDLMLAAVHYLLAREPGQPLARYYPTLSDQVPDGDPVPLFREFCLDHVDQLAAIVSSRPVQTNEVRRCTYLLPAIMLTASMTTQPLALIEPGASAGLNLALDSYAYDYGTGAVLGPGASPLRLRCDLRGPRQPPLNLPMPQIGWRAGIDLHPLNPASPQDAAWLHALVWADHPGRAVLLRGALAAAAARPPIPMYTGDAAGQLPTVVASAPPDMTICLFHTAFLAHVPPPGRERFGHLAAALSITRPVYWIQAEPRRDPAEPRLRLTLCQEGRITGEWPLGRYHPHGDWLEWLATSTPAISPACPPESAASSA